MLRLFLTAFSVIIAELDSCLERRGLDESAHLPTTAPAEPAASIG